MSKLTARLQGVSDAIKNTDALDKILNKIGRKMMGEVGQFMVHSSKRNFNNEQAPDGKRWKKLKEQTKNRKGHSRILFETGALNRSIQVISLGNDKVSVGISGTEVKKALTHQFGRDEIPARPFLGFSKPRDDEKKIKGIVVRHVQREVRQIT